jgi:hypothetical protein
MSAVIMQSYTPLLSCKACNTPLRPNETLGTIESEGGRKGRGGDERNRVEDLPSHLTLFATVAAGIDLPDIRVSLSVRSSAVWSVAKQFVAREG